MLLLISIQLYECESYIFNLHQVMFGRLKITSFYLFWLFIWLENGDLLAENEKSLKNFINSNSRNLMHAKKFIYYRNILMEKK